VKHYFLYSLILLSFSLIIPSLHASDSRYAISQLRSLYPKASQEESTGRKFYEQMAAYKGSEPVVLGYKAVSEALMAKFVWSPYQKIKHVRNSGKIFQEALSQHPRHPEVRFLRYTVEYSVPRYLKMSEHLAEDRDLIADHLLRFPESGVDPEGFRLMSAFMLKENHLSAAEKAVISRKLAGRP
jgi:hypothetical protein